jgi:protein O-GlcNAc transferase
MHYNVRWFGRTTRMYTRLIAILAAAACLTWASGCMQTNPLRQKQAVDHYVQGQMLADKGEFDAALAELAKAARIDPNLSIVHAAMGDIHRNRGDFGPARVSYEKACQTNPYAFRPHYNLGVVYQGLAAAATRAEQAADYLRQAANVYLRAVTLEPGDFDSHLNLSACYYSLGKLDLAEKYCKAAIALDAHRPEAYSNLGIIYDSQGQGYQAIKAYRDSLELDVHQPKLLMNLGAAYVKQGRLRPAVQAFEAAATEDPSSAEAWQQLGTCQYHLKQYEQSLECYRKAIACDPASAAAHRGLGVVYMTQYVMDRQKAELRDKALSAWHASLEINPNQKDILDLVSKYSPKPAQPPL